MKGAQLVPGDGRVCVVGAGSSGLAALKTLTSRGFDPVAFEERNALGGNWCIGDVSEPTAAYDSLRTNVSRRRMQYPSFPIPKAYGDFVHHTDMADYLQSYAQSADLLGRIRLGHRVTAVEPDTDAGWEVFVDSRSQGRFGAVVIASGHHRKPRWPRFAGDFEGALSHSSQYRTNAPFRDKRVLVVGSGQSALEVASEVSRVAAKTFLAVRRVPHLVPSYLAGQPYDLVDIRAFSYLPLRLTQTIFGALVRAQRGQAKQYLGRSPDHRLFEDLPPVVCSDAVLGALRNGAVTVKPTVARLRGDSVEFVDDSHERIDAIVCATGYEVEFPFLAQPPTGGTPSGVPLYRRIVAPATPGLYWIGLIDPLAGLLPLVEAQSAWLADLLEGRLVLPPREAMISAIAQRERRTRQRFPRHGADATFCDRFGYLRMLEADRRRDQASGLAAAMRHS